MSKDYNKLSEHIRTLAAKPPEQLIDHLADTHKDLTAVAPNLAPHISTVGIKALNYLHQTMPKPAFEAPGQTTWEPSKSQKTQWLDKHEMVNDPISVLDHVKHGTLTSSHLEALQAVHPELLQDMRNKVMENAHPKNMEKLSYIKKIAVSKFLGQPMSQALLPGVLAADQASFNPPAQQATGAPKQKGSTLGGLSKLSMSKRAETETQKDETDV